MPHELHRPAPILPGDEERVEFLRSLNILDTKAEASFDRITEAASTILQTPVALVSLVDKDRQWFKSKVGVDICETSRDMAFCSHAIIQPDSRPFIVDDASQDERFKYSDLVLGEPHIRFYAGAPLVITADDGSSHKIGTLCVLDKTPRKLEEEQIILMETLARLVVAEIELRDRLAGLHEKQINQVQEGAQVSSAFADMPQYLILTPTRRNGRSRCTRPTSARHSRQHKSTHPSLSPWRAGAHTAARAWQARTALCRPPQRAARGICLSVCARARACGCAGVARARQATSSLHRHAHPRTIRRRARAVAFDGQRARARPRVRVRAPAPGGARSPHAAAANIPF